MEGLQTYIKEAKRGKESYPFYRLPTSIIAPNGLNPLKTIYDRTFNGKEIFCLSYYAWGKKVKSDAANVSFVDNKYPDLTPEEAYKKVDKENCDKEQQDLEEERRIIEEIKGKAKVSYKLQSIVNWLYKSENNRDFILHLYRDTEVIELMKDRILYHNKDFGYMFLEYCFGSCEYNDAYYEAREKGLLDTLRLRLVCKTKIFDNKEDALLYIHKVSMNYRYCEYRDIV